jgi:hypothetical protein
MVKNLTVFGAGLMGMSSSPTAAGAMLIPVGCVGAGIAQVAAQNGFKVILSDVTEVSPLFPSPTHY